MSEHVQVAGAAEDEEDKHLHTGNIKPLTNDFISMSWGRLASWPTGRPISEHHVEALDRSFKPTGGAYNSSVRIVCDCFAFVLISLSLPSLAKGVRVLASSQNSITYCVCVCVVFVLNSPPLPLVSCELSACSSHRRLPFFMRVS